MENKTTDKVHVERFLDLPIDKVWDLMTKPEHVTTWWGKGIWNDKEGGEYELHFTEGILTGKVLKVDPPHTFVFTFVHGSVPEQEVTFTLKEQDGGTLWIIDHTGFDKMMSEMRKKEWGEVNGGWNHFADKLIELGKELYGAGTAK